MWQVEEVPVQPDVRRSEVLATLWRCALMCLATKSRHRSLYSQVTSAMKQWSRSSEEYLQLEATLASLRVAEANLSKCLSLLLDLRGHAGLIPKRNWPEWSRRYGVLFAPTLLREKQPPENNDNDDLPF